MTPSTALEGTTRAPKWSATEETRSPAKAPVPDLMTAFTAAIDARKSVGIPEAVHPDAVAAFDAAFEWAMRQDFDDDYAERVRREAWGRRETQ
jgi:hypothetical protein